MTDTFNQVPLQVSLQVPMIIEAAHLLRNIKSASAGTVFKTGAPCVTLVNVALSLDGMPLLCLSGLSQHTHNLKNDMRLSLLLIKSGKGDPLTHPRLSLFGNAYELGEPSCNTLERDCFLKAHPKAKIYMQLPDFRLWRVALESAHFNGGFARAAQFTAQELIHAVNALSV